MLPWPGTEWGFSHLPLFYNYSMKHRHREFLLVLRRLKVPDQGAGEDLERLGALDPQSPSGALRPTG